MTSTADRVKQEIWLSPSRREMLRNGGKPFTAAERAFVRTYEAHQEARRAADERRS